MRGLRFVVLFMGAALLLSACSGVPRSGPIQTGAALQAVDGSGVIRVIARPPIPDASPLQIVQGFLAASSSLSDLSIAAQYLTPYAQQAWDRSGVTVIRGAIQATQVADSAIQVSGALDGVVDKTDHWQVAAQGQQFTTSFTVAEIDGQWRIATLPDGVIISRTAADRALRSYDVLFLDPNFETLVPDPVTVAITSAGLATTLIRRLLQGPSAWLAPAVTTAIPDGTRLALESVPIINGVAQVQLTEEVLAANTKAREALSAQIVRTLAPVPGVQSVAISVGGAPLVGVNLNAVQSLSSFSEFGPDLVRSPNPFALVNGQPVSINRSDAAVSPRGTFAQPLLELDLARDARRWAAVTERRNSLVTGVTDQPGSEIFEGANLASPQVVGDSTWVVQRGIGIFSITGSVARPVPVSDVDGQSLDGSVLSVRIARDRTRAALVVRESGRSRLLLARIESSGGSTRLVGAKRIENNTADVVDVAWQSSSRLAVLEGTGGGTTRLVTLWLGLNSAQYIDVPSGATRIAAAPGQTVLVEVASGDKATIYIRSSGRWTPLVAAEAPVYP